LNWLKKQGVDWPQTHTDKGRQKALKLSSTDFTDKGGLIKGENPLVLATDTQGQRLTKSFADLKQ
jgi:photosystem II stability/assembly factor-like uncharacterized protein